MIIFGNGFAVSSSTVIYAASRVLKTLWQEYQQHPTIWNSCFLWGLTVGVLIYLVGKSAKYVGRGRDKNKSINLSSDRSPQTSQAGAQNSNLPRSSKQKLDVIPVAEQASQATVGELMDYWVIIGREKRGPFTLDQLKQQDIHAASLVWREGTAAWVSCIKLS